MASGKDANTTTSMQADKIKINFASVEDLQKLPTVGKKTAEKINQFRLTMGNVTPESIHLIQYIKMSEFPMDQVDWEENGELNIATADDSQNVTDSSDPGVVHTQKLISEVAEMVDQEN
jgi:3-methyladenine DNA glycosylase/8-oxoguanine DNA glycosylase